MSKPNAKPQTEAQANTPAQEAAAPAADLAAALVQPQATGQGGLYTMKDGQRVLVHQTQAV
ncbi:MAG TPA: hypothetical protein PK925_02145 [Alicycliphilus sp.]|nr:hypothetical protein [Alicycliphilus sp.]